MLGVEARRGARQLLPLLPLGFERGQRRGESHPGHLIALSRNALLQRFPLSHQALVVLRGEETAQIAVPPGQVAASDAQRGDGLVGLDEDVLHGVRRGAQLGEDPVADGVDADVPRILLPRCRAHRRGRAGGPLLSLGGVELPPDATERAEPLRALLLRRRPCGAADVCRVRSRERRLRHPAVSGDHPGAARPEPRRGKDQPPEKGERGERDDEEDDRSQQPEVPFEQAGVRHLGLALGAAAQLALEPPLPPLASPIRVGAAQVLRPFADHLVLLGGATRDRLLGAAQRRLELFLPVVGIPIRHESPRIRSTSPPPPHRYGISSAATRPRSSTERTLSTRSQCRA